MRPAFRATLIFLLFAAPPAFADQKRMAANNCELQNDNQSVYYDRGGARIGADQTLVGFVCPLLRANTTNTNGLLALKVNLFKQHSTAFLCAAESYDQNGSVLKSVAKQITTTGLVSVNWTNTLNVSSSKGTYGLVCYAQGPAPNVPEWGDELYSIDYTEP